MIDSTQEKERRVVRKRKKREKVTLWQKISRFFLIGKYKNAWNSWSSTKRKLRERESGENKLYVGNIPYTTKEEELESFFNKIGKVDSARVIRDKKTGKAKGFAFVEMQKTEDAQKAIISLNRKDFGGRNIVIRQAK